MTIERKLSIDPKFDTKQFCILQEVNGTEGINELFSYKLSVACANHDLSADDIIGTELSFSINEEKNSSWNSVKTFSGIISEMQADGFQDFNYSEQSIKLKIYHFTVMPKLSILKQTQHSRVYQKTGQTINNIIESLLDYYKITYKNDIKDSPKKEYCLQYNESDYDFILRLLNESSAFFYFSFVNGKNQLCLANNQKSYLSSSSKLSHASDGLTKNNITSWSVQSKIVADAFASNDFDSSQPDKNLYTESETDSEQNTDKKLVKFNYPGKFSQKSEANTLNDSLLNSEESNKLSINAKSNLVLSSGCVYPLEGNFFDNYSGNKIVIGELSWCCKDYRGFFNPNVDPNADSSFSYSNDFVAYPDNITKLPDIPERKIDIGLQIATIVDAEGKSESKQACYNDKYGNVCIKFVWEDYNSGLKTNNFDQANIPVIYQWDNGIYRVGTKVIVSFINHNLDTPTILGTINDANSLPIGSYDETNAMQTLLKRREGSDNGSNYNYISFDDKQEKENITIFAGKDMYITVNKGDRIIQINEGSESLTIDKGSQSIKITEGNQDIVIDKGTRNITIGDDETCNNKANFSQTVDKDYTLTVKGNLKANVTGAVNIKSDKSIELDGGNEITLKAKNVDIKSSNINLN